MGRTIEELQKVLELAIVKRSPTFPPDESPRIKISAIEEYLLDVAILRGELEEAFHWLQLLVEHFKEEIDQMTGWEARLHGSKPTRQDVLNVKRQMNPTAFEAGGDARRLRDSIHRQIARFEFERDTLSRVYTMIVGG